MAGNALLIKEGGTSQTTPAGARIALGLEVGVDIQPHDADLDAISALSTTGLATRTAANTWTTRTLTAPAAGFTITNPAGIAGNPTFVLANDLSAVEALSTNGIVTRTATDTWTTRTITGTANRITVTNGDGVAGVPTLDIAATYIGQASITTLGTVVTGVWNGTDIAVADGGTGVSTITGLLSGNGTSALVGRTIVVPTGMSISNGNGATGNPTISLADDLSAVEGLSSNGIVTRTASNTWTTRTLTGTANKITVTNGDGVAGNPTLTIPDAVTLVTPTVTGLLDITGSQIKFANNNDSANTATLDGYSDYIPYTPTFTGFGTAASVNIQSKRIGDSLYIRGSFTTGTPTAVEARISMGVLGVNGGLTSDTTKVASIQLAGDLLRNATGAVSYYTLIESGVGYITIGQQAAGTSPFSKVLANAAFGVGAQLTFDAVIPISGW